MSISFGSINTGLPKDIVQQIMKAERMPLQTMETRKGKIQDKKALVQELINLAEDVRGHLASNSTARSLREFKVETNNELVDVTVDKNVAQPGNYQFEVVKLAQKSSAMSSGFEDPEESYVGVGFIQYYTPDGEKNEIYVDEENSSLKKIAKLINKDASNGMRANVVNDGTDSDTPWRLIVSLDETGDNKVADFPYLYFVDGEEDFFLEQERKAHDAVVRMDGFEIEVPENKASELIPGVTIDLKKASPGDEFAIQVLEDTAKISGKVTDLVEKINNVLRFIKEQNSIDESTDTSRTLGGDIMLQSLEGRLRSTVFKDIETEFGYMRFGDLGVTFQRDGLLGFDQAKFESQLKDNYKKVSQVLYGYYTEDGKKSGFVDQISDTFNTTLRFPDGLLQSRKRSLENNINAIDRRIKQRERMLEQKEKNLKDRFSRLEGTIANMRSQGAGLAGMGAAPNLVSQLG